MTTEKLPSWLGMELVKISEMGAIASSNWIGRGDKIAADQAAVDAIRSGFNALEFDGRVVIGEGERDEAPMLYIGEKVGSGTGPEIDIALDPLEGTSLTARNQPDALSVIAFAPRGEILFAPDVYMQKIACGPEIPVGLLDITQTHNDNIRAAAEGKKKKIEDVTVCVLDRPRHEGIIEAVQSLGARLKLIPDGDVAGILHTTNPTTGVDLYLGSGGAPEGVLAAAALRATGGFMQGKLLFDKPEEKMRGERLGIRDFDKIYTLDELVGDDTLFVATGVTNGALVEGVRHNSDHIQTETLLLHAKAKTRHIVSTQHYP